MSSTSEPLALSAAKAGWNREAKVISLVAVAHFMSHVHGMLLPPILGQVKEAFGVSYTQVALAITVFNIASALLQTPTGFLVDRIGPRFMLTGGLILTPPPTAAPPLLPGSRFFLIPSPLIGLPHPPHGQLRPPDLRRGRHGRAPRHAGFGRQRGAVGLPAVQRRRRATGRHPRRSHAAP